MRPFIRNTVFFVGWVLSPLTFWNDAFVNIPLSYLMANILVRLIKADFLWLVLISYWITNILGVYLMYAAGKDVVRKREGVVKDIISLIITTAAYSLIIVVLSRMGIIRPLSQ